MILLDYVDCHDFDMHVISVDYKNRVPFPYLPTTLLADEKSKNMSIKGLDVNFPTFCTALYIKDLQILNKLYDFAITKGMFDIDTNNVISCIQKYFELLKSIFDKNVLPHIRKGLYSEVKKYYVEFEQLSVNELCKLYSKNRGHIVKRPNDIKLVNSLICKDDLQEYADQDASPILGDLSGPKIGEMVDILSLYPFNLTIQNGVISGIDWSH